MAGIMRGDVEILVHTTAPSRGKDDARYRALAQAYLDFEPSEGRRIDSWGTEDEVESQLQEELHHSTQEERESEASYRPESIPSASTESQPIYINRIELLGEIGSPDLSFNSVTDSPRFRNFLTRRQEPKRHESEKSRIGGSQDSWGKPPSTVADSQPEPERPAPLLSSPSRIWEVFLPKAESSEEPGSGDHQNPSPELPYGLSQVPSSRSANDVPIVEASSASEQPSSPSPNQVVRSLPPRILRKIDHNIPSTQDCGEGLKRKRGEVESSEENQTSSSAPPKLAIGSSVSVSSSFDPASKRQRVMVDHVEVVEANPSTAIPSSKATEVATSSPENAGSIWADRLEIRPPAPKVSSTELTPESLITWHLSEVMRKFPSGFYKPESQTRGLRAMERGYWLVDCSGWDLRLRKRCWEYLGSFAGHGLAGWGVWCVRDEEFGSLRVYCWGIVVPYIYLLLYTGSENKIKKHGACWIGGDGVAIIRMPS